MFIAVYTNFSEYTGSFHKYIGEGETIAEAIMDLEGYMEKEGIDPSVPDNYSFYSVKPVKVKLEYTIIE